MLGHMFQARLRSTTKNASPVFHQFLEIVAMLLRKTPNAFEFRENLLVDLACVCSRGVPRRSPAADGIETTRPDQLTRRRRPTPRRGRSSTTTSARA